MYLTHALVLNSGPLSNLEWELKFGQDGRPKATVLVGRNGAGKSNFLGFLTDALIELAAQNFNDVAPQQPMGGHQWHRVIGKATIRTGSNHELALLRFEHEGNDFTYVSKGGQIAKQDIEHMLDAFPDAPNWPPEGHHKSVGGPNGQIEMIFRQGCYVSFPTDRAETPYWSGRTAKKEESVFADRFSNELQKPISVGSSLSALKPWLVDVLLDQMVDGLALIQNPQTIQQALVNAAANHTALSNVNSLLRTILGEPEARLVRTGRQSGSRKLMVFKGDELLLPSLDAFSSGQAMLFGMFGMILKYADAGNVAKPTTEMEGIVAIDEVDAHLHADLQHDILPRMIGLFPKIQFILSAHSPLFPLGMEREFGEEGYSLLEMPSGNQINAERFSEFRSSFDYLKATRSFDDSVLERASQLQRPQIYCEGHTDPKYFQTAAELLGFDQLRNVADFDWIGVMANGQARDGGEGQLRQAKKILSNNPSILQSHTVLLFDCDVNEQEFDQDLLHARVLEQNTANNLCDKGVENLLPAEVFEDNFFQTSTVKDGANQTTKRVLNKTALCDYLCDQKRSAQDFEGFRPSLEMLTAIVFPQMNDANQ
jgi:hypothetical protein